jgi:hypothetical protein
MLRMLQKMAWADFDGHLHHDSHHSPAGLQDLDGRKRFNLAAVVFPFGFKPALVPDLMRASISSLITTFGG